MMTTTIYTVGHSTKTAEELTALLAENDIQTVVDVRSRPYSRFHPQFNKNRLAEYLPAAEIRYEPRGDNLGGLDKNVRFDESLDEMFERAGKGERIALMCSEGSFKKCHRGDTLTWPLVRRGATVVHLEWGGKDPVVVDNTPKVATPKPAESTLF